MLRFFKHFAKTYVNDILIHFYIFNEYLSHLRQLFILFHKKRVNLSFIKFFLRYSSITLLIQ